MRRIIILGMSLACATSVFAAKPIHLQNQPVSFLQSFISASQLKPVSSSVDFNHVEHIRLKQMYAGYPVWGGDAIAHVPQGSKTSLATLAANQSATMNGIMYEELDKDLNKTSKDVLNATQAKQALQHAVQLYQKKSANKQVVSETETSAMVYVDDNNQAHWAFLVSFLVEKAHAKPTYILDAKTLAVYEQWDNIQTLEESAGGGFGGNVKMGKLVYDGLQNDLPFMTMERDAGNKLCYLENADVTVENYNDSDVVMTFPCEAQDGGHGNIYWDADQDAVNGGYSPENDALYAGKVIKEMYQKWYGVPVLVENGKPMMLVMRVHVPHYDNAYWDGKRMTFGDGESVFYPLVSLGVAAHEVSHGFTQQHSGLVYSRQSGGLNEAFSDMAAQAAEFYSVGHSSWQIGPEIFKSDRALRYMDEPTRDGRSIDNVKDYRDWIDVHYSSGIFNKAFFLMAKGWSNANSDATKMAFDVMVKANMSYWTPRTTFADAACGVVNATRDYAKSDPRYTEIVVANAMAGVGIDTSKC